MNKIFALTLLFTFFLISCNQNNQNPVRQSFGNAGRTNNFEEFGSFYSKYHRVEEIQDSDIRSFSGYPLFIPPASIVSTTSDNSIAYISGSRLQWELFLDDNEFPVTDFAYNKGLIYFVSNFKKVYAVDIKGEIKHSQKLVSDTFIFGSPLILNGKLFISSYYGKIWRFDLELNIEKDTTLDGLIEKGITSNGVYIFANIERYDKTSSLLQFDFDLNLKKSLNEKINTFYGLPVSKENLVISFKKISISNQNVYEIIACDSLLNPQWKRESLMTPIFSSIDGEYNSYIVMNKAGFGEIISKLVKYDSKGKQRAELNLNITISTPVIIGQKYLIFIGQNAESFGLYYIDKNSLNLVEIMDLSSNNLINKYPAITSSNILKFTSSSANRIITVESSIIDRY